MLKVLALAFDYCAGPELSVAVGQLGAFDDNGCCRCSMTRQPSETSSATTRVVLAFLEGQIDELASLGMW